MFPQTSVHALLRPACVVVMIASAGTLGARAQEAAPPAYLGSVDGQATLERDGVAEPATLNMPFVPGDRLRTAAGRVEIVFPDGSGIEVGEYSEVEAVSATRVRLLAGTMDHIQRPVATSRSASYLPSDLRTYGNTFDQYGSWQYDSPYGYVWYPAVGPDWRPYSHGSWSPIHSYGWTWIGLDAWAWPTHHYGRWGYARNSWFWIPGRTWGAAWVSWSFSDDYVSWCPLGYDSRPVFALAVGTRRGWERWTVPRRGFGARGYVNDYSRTRGQSSLASRQSSVGSHQSSVLSHQSTAIGRQSTGFDRQAQAIDRQAQGLLNRQSPAIGRQSTDNGRPRTEDSRSRAGDSRLRSDDYRLRTDDRRLTTVAPPSYRGREQPQRSGNIPPPQATPVLPGASGGAYAGTRVGSREPVVGRRESAVESRDRRASTDYRPTRGDRPPTPDSRPRPAAPAPSPAAPAASGGAPASRSTPHERAAPAAASEARPRAEGRPAGSHRPR